MVGAIIRYSTKSNEPDQFFLAIEQNTTNSTNCSKFEFTFEVGSTIQINTLDDSFTCAVGGKVFKDAEGNFIRTTVKGLSDNYVGAEVSGWGRIGRQLRWGREGCDKEYEGEEKQHLLSVGAWKRLDCAVWENKIEGEKPGRREGVERGK